MPSNSSPSLQHLSESDDDLIDAHVPIDLVGERLDVIAAQLFPEYSRGRLQQWIKDEHLLVNGFVGKPKQKLQGGETLTLLPVMEAQGEWLPEDIPLNIIYQDEHIMVLNKERNRVVHPAVGNQTGTLLNGLLNFDQNLANLPRGGIVHRLDKDTTGLMVVARSLSAHQSLVAQLQARTVGRHYYAVVHGLVPAEGFVDAPIGRHPVNRKKMAVVNGGKEARTHYQVQARYKRHTLLRLKLETGRTHQIRVHMQSIGFPLVGDPQYGSKRQTDKALSGSLNVELKDFPRQALHAGRLELLHPETGENLFWECDLPEDMANLIKALEAEK